MNWSSLGSREVPKQRAVSILGREVHAVGDALKPIEAVALDNDLRAILERIIAGIRVDGRRSAANRVAVRVVAASTGTNSRAYWNFESSSLQRRVCKLSVPSRVRPAAGRKGQAIDGATEHFVEETRIRAAP